MSLRGPYTQTLRRWMTWLLSIDISPIGTLRAVTERRAESLREHDLQLVWRDRAFWLLSVRADVVGIPVQMRGEHWSGPFLLGCVQVGASTP